MTEKVKVSIFKDNESLAEAAAIEIIRVVSDKPNALLCLAAGDTPLRTYQRVAETAKQDGTDFSRVNFVALDEWVGIDPSNRGSCQYFLKHSLFEPLGIAGSQQHFFDAMSKNMDHECQTMNSFIAAMDGIDLILVGVGMNGHIGFNEPGVSPDLYAHIITLDDTTLRVGQKYFTQATSLQQGVTLGLRHFMEAKTAIVMASDLRKASIMKEALEDEISIQIPASIVRRHPHGLVMLDQEAGSLLTKK